VIKTDYKQFKIKGNNRVVYVCGPYRNSNEELKRENILHALRISVRLWELGWFCITPHLNTANFEFYTDLDEDVWLEGGLEILSRCDCIFCLKGWETSQGSMKEFELAQKLEKDVYYEDTH